MLDQAGPGPIGPIGRFAAGAACAIFDPAGRVLLVRHTYGRHNWELPGGVVQPNEAPAAAAERELAEETALGMRAGPLTGVYFEAGHDFGPMLHFVIRVEPPPASAPVAQPPEIDKVGCFATDDLPSPISDFTERRIRDAVAGGAAFAVIDGRTWRT
jgi:8-oxo-dGTP diphosphatase